MRCYEYLGSSTKAQRELLSESLHNVQATSCYAFNECSKREIFQHVAQNNNLPSLNDDSERLNHLMILQIYNQLTDEIDLIKIANEFVLKNEYRQSTFGKFMPSDLQK